MAKKKIIEDKPIVLEPTIYDKYDLYIKQYASGYVSGLSYGDKKEILAYCELKSGRTIPINIDCGSCVMDLMKLFIRLKGE